MSDHGSNSETRLAAIPSHAVRSSLTQAAVKTGAVMAFDFGERRIGVALGDLALGISHPLTTIECRRGVDYLPSIELLVNEWRPVLLVVGLPVNTDGLPHKLAPLVRRFSESLNRKFELPCHLVDERYTSSEASSILRDAGVRGRRQKMYVDQVAAQTILEDFFSQGGYGS